MIFQNCSCAVVDSDGNLVALGVDEPSFDLSPEDDSYFKFDADTTALSFMRGQRLGYVSHARWYFPWDAPMRAGDQPIQGSLVSAGRSGSDVWSVIAGCVQFDGSRWICLPDDNYNIFIFQKHDSVALHIDEPVD